MPRTGGRRQGDEARRCQLHAGLDDFEEVSRVHTPELAYLLEIERAETTLTSTGETQQIPLRVTTVFRREDGQWKISHRHADPVSAARLVTAKVEDREQR